MSRKHIRLDTKQQKAIYENFSSLASRHGHWEVWVDFITMAACSLCPSDHKKHEAEYANIAKKYTSDELNRFAGMLASTIESLEINPHQDFLGDLFMRFDLGNTWKGQFFTPYHVSICMAKMIAGNLKEQLKEKAWVSVCDPTVGAGALLIAFAQECLLQEINYQTDVLFVAQDIDRTAAMMAFLQLSLLGCPGYVVVGDSILHPITGPSLLLPIPHEGQEIWYTPMMATDIWQRRIAWEKLKYCILSESNKVQ